MDDPLEKFGGRKFIFGILGVVLSFILVLMGKLNADAWATFIEVIGGTYVIGNVGATVANKLGNKVGE